MEFESGKRPYLVLKGVEFPRGTVREEGTFLGLTDEEATGFAEGLIAIVEPVMRKHIITEVDAEYNKFDETDVKVGDEIELPIYPREALRAVGVPVDDLKPIDEQEETAKNVV